MLKAEPPKPKQLVFNASGGSQIASLRENYLNDFEKETGIKIVDTSPVDFGKLRAMVESGNVVWNITEIGGQDGYRVTQMGLAEPIDAKIVDRSKFQPQAQMSHVFSPSCYSTVIAYRPDAFPNGAPKSWADFWDVKAFPGPRSLRNHPVDNIEAALMADGVAPDKLYPLDVDRAFKKLDHDPQAHQCLVEHGAAAGAAARRQGGGAGDRVERALLRSHPQGGAARHGVERRHPEARQLDRAKGRQGPVLGDEGAWR